MKSILKKNAAFFLLALLAATSIACMAVTRMFIEPTPTPLPTQTLVPFTSTPAPSATIMLTFTPTVDFCPDGDCITACLKQMPAIAMPTSPSKGIQQAHRAGGSEKSYVLVTYTVSGDQIDDPIDSADIPKNYNNYQQDLKSQQKIWDYFSAIIPPEQRRFLTEYDIFTDGRDNILASVSQSDTEIGKWVLRVDIVDAANPQDLTVTLVHEFGHLLTLNSTQILPSQAVFDHPNSGKIYQQAVDACSTYFVGEGCSKADSYINTFFDRFWPDIYVEWSKIDTIENEKRYYTELEKFYEKYQEEFVTNYAPTNPAEDIAETFSFFILQPKPTGDSIADQKVLFFYEFPELIQLRSQIGHRLCGQIEK